MGLHVYVTVGGVRLYSEVSGSGAPVLVLHGGFCSLESIRPQLTALSRRRQVLAYERPGHGRSPDVAAEYSYTSAVSTALAYLDVHGLGAVHVLGQSDGAIIGLLLALQHPGRVRSLVAVSANLDPSAFSPATEPGARLTAAAEESDDNPPMVDEERVVYDRLSPDGPGHADVVLDKLVRLWASEPNIAPADLASITAPVLVLAGDRDSVPPAHSLLIAASITGAQLGILPGTTHGLLEEQPDLVSLLTTRFFDDLDRD